MNTRFGRMTAAALIVGLLIVTLGMVSVASASTPERRVTPPAPLSDAEEAALLEAIDEEYLARDTYQAILDKLGPDVIPFSKIVLSEQQHVDTVAALFVKYGLPTPSDLVEANPQFETKREACQIGVDAELHDIGLYDRLLASGDIEHADLIQVFTDLRAASLNNHWPAFDRCN
jgi:hypothetical protein